MYRRFLDAIHCGSRPASARRSKNARPGVDSRRLACEPLEQRTLLSVGVVGPFPALGSERIPVRPISPIPNGPAAVATILPAEGDAPGESGLPAENLAAAAATDYMIYDHWGDTWHDANKELGNNNNELPWIDDWGNTDDDLLCWAAAASNILAWTDWGPMALGTNDAGVIFDYFQGHWVDDGYWSDDAWRWWFKGDQGYDTPTADNSYVDTPGGGGFFPDTNFDDCFRESGDTATSVPYIKECFQNGYGVALSLADDDNELHHAITCWGYQYDSATDEIYGIYITDSDDNELDLQGRELEYHEVEMRGDNWYLLNYEANFFGWGGDGAYINWVYGLKNPDPPTVELQNTVDLLRENTDTTGRIKVADIVVTDDGVGHYQLALTGADAASFEIDGDELFLKAGTTLDYETKTQFDVTVEVDNPDIGNTPDDTAAHILQVLDVRGAISGFVYADTNGNARPDQYEGVPCVLVTLTGNGLFAETWTDDHGWYEFHDLSDGTYTVTERHPGCMIDGGNNTLAGITVAEQDVVVQNFREVGLKAYYVVSAFSSTRNMPVGSKAWYDLYKSVVAKGAKDAGQTPTLPPSVMPMILQQGSQVIVRGTSGDDTFSFIAADNRNGLHQISFNGESFFFDASVVTTIRFDGGLGTDSASFVGSPAADEFFAAGKSASLLGPHYFCEVFRVETTTASAANPWTGGLGGKVRLEDSAIDDVLRTETADSLSLAAFYYRHVVTGFEEVTAVSSHGGNDRKSVAGALNYVLITQGPWI